MAMVRCVLVLVFTGTLLPQCSELFLVEPTKWHEFRGMYLCKAVVTRRHISQVCCSAVHLVCMSTFVFIIYSAIVRW